MAQSGDSMLSLAVRIVISYVEQNAVPASDLPGLIHDVYTALAKIAPDAGSPRATTRRSPSGETIFGDHLVCLECGLHMKMLKRHLETVHNATPAEYRAKWHLPAGYPMVSPDYASLRSSLAKESGLGRRPMPRAR